MISCYMCKYYYEEFQARNKYHKQVLIIQYDATINKRYNLYSVSIFLYSKLNGMI